ncbi:dockerin type I repeat-containing protein [Ruminiclostridium josui]|nr:dockerin type I repeat-containing protein [Ruminiclostridium josui]
MWGAGGPELDFTISSATNTWDASNDWSFEDWDSTYINGTRKYAPNIPIYEGNNFKKLAGNEPAGGSEEPPIILAGDINKDGNIDALDVALLKKYLLGNALEYDVSVADMNSDKNIDALDFALLKKTLLSQ